MEIFPSPGPVEYGYGYRTCIVLALHTRPIRPPTGSPNFEPHRLKLYLSK